MVKVGILGAETPIAGEIIRILINHPETEMVALYAPGYTGRSVSRVHHGLIGEIALNFTDKINLEEIDFLIIAEDSEISKTIIDKFFTFENLKIVILPEISLNLDKEKGFETGISEINRKALVRGARAAFIFSPELVPALIALIPLASFLLLNSDLDIEVSLPEDLASKVDIAKDILQLENMLKLYQNSFMGKIDLKIISDAKSERACLTKINFKNSLTIEEIEKIYDQIYNDHNFTFITNQEIKTEDVEGTHKNLIYLSKPEPDVLQIDVVSDSRMRGGAGDVVHMLNLFFGLHEKTGLNLKPSRYIACR